MHCVRVDSFFFFNDTATTEIYTLSLHDALPISCSLPRIAPLLARSGTGRLRGRSAPRSPALAAMLTPCRLQRSLRRSEEHTSELQSRQYLVCRLLLEKKTNIPKISIYIPSQPSS